MRIDSPKAGRELGIGMVYQHLSLIPTLSVLENLMLGSNPGLVLDVAAARARLAELSATLGVTVDADARVGALSLGQQQHIEIIKALWKGSQVLILDEPTSMLTPQGIEELQKVLLGLKAAGLAIIFITHKLHEAIAIGDRVAVLKQGRVVGSIDHELISSSTPHQLQQLIVEMMFGEQPEAPTDIAELREEASVEHAAHDIGEALVLEVVAASAYRRGRPTRGRLPWLVSYPTCAIDAARAHAVLRRAQGLCGHGQRRLAYAGAFRWRFATCQPLGWGFS